MQIFKHLGGGSSSGLSCGGCWFPIYHLPFSKMPISHTISYILIFNNRNLFQLVLQSFFASFEQIVICQFRSSSFTSLWDHLISSFTSFVVLEIKLSMHYFLLKNLILVNWFLSTQKNNINLTCMIYLYQQKITVSLNQSITLNQVKRLQYKA